MADSRIPETPPRTIPSNARVDETRHNPQHPIKGRLETAPDNIKNEKSEYKIQGQVVRAVANTPSSNATIRIQTNDGVIDVRIDNNQTPPTQGQIVKITIQPGPTPQTVMIDTADRNDASIRTIQTPINIDFTQPGNTSPIPDILKAPTSPASFKNHTMSLPEPGQVVRLQASQPLNLNILEPLKTEVHTVTFPISKLTSISLNNPISLSIPETPTDQILTSVLLSEPAAFNNASPFIPPPSAFIFRKQPFVELDIPAPAYTSTKTAIPENNVLDISISTSTVSQNPSSIYTTLPSTSALQDPARNPTINDTTPPSPFPLVLDMHITAVHPPTSQILTIDQQSDPIDTKPSISSASSIRAGEIKGTIIGHDEANLPLVQIRVPQTQKNDVFVMQTPVDKVVPGTEIIMVPHLPPSSVVPELASLLSFLTPGLWSTLNETASILTQTQTSSAQVLTALTPQAHNPAQMPPAVMLFIAAVRGGDLTGWIGERTMDMLRRSEHADVVRRMGQDSAFLNQLSETVSGDWRSTSIPLMWQNEIHKIIMHYKQDDPAHDDNSPKDKQSRFIFDLAVPNIGKVQLDGLYRINRLDLILRTEHAFSKAMQMDMKQTYIHAIGQSNLEGELSFQNDLSQWVTIDVEKDGFGTEA